MPTTITATEARVHFGAVLRRVAEDGETIIVERSGQTAAVILPPNEYQRLKETQSKETWRGALEEIRRIQERIYARRGGEPLPSPVDIIRQMREERDAQIVHVLGPEPRDDLAD